MLLKYQGQAFSKRQIYEQITEDGERVDYHTVEITISRIRKKLDSMEQVLSLRRILQWCSWLPAAIRNGMGGLLWQG